MGAPGSKQAGGGMTERVLRIGVAAPSNRIEPETAQMARALAGTAFPGRIELVVHPQCFLSFRHFAGEDSARAAAFLELANDPSLDAVWCARGGYGAGRITDAIIAGLGPGARNKTYLGYSDSGFLLAGLYKHGVVRDGGRVVHGPVLNDILRPGGEKAVQRALGFLLGDSSGVEPSVKSGEKRAAFNLTVLSHILGTPLEPDLTGHVLMIEDVSEHMYRIDRALFHVLSTSSMRGIAGLRLGRVSDVPENDPPFVIGAEEVARFWCERAGVAYLGRADIGHDVDNKIVPFGG